MTILNKMTKHTLPRLRLMNLLLSVCVLVLPGWMEAAQEPPAQMGGPALIEVEIGDEAGLEALVPLELPVYTRLYSPQGDVSLIAAADAELQQALIQRGYTLHVLDPSIQGASYYLLLGQPEILRLAQEVTDILLIEGRQAIARPDPDKLAELVEMGIGLTPLVPWPLEASAPGSEAPLSPDIVTFDPLVQEMVSQVRSQALYNLVGSLSGEWEVTISGAPYTIATRFTYTDVPMKKATRYAYEYFQALGLPSGFDTYSFGEAEKRNVIAEQTGLTDPDKIVLLIAHLDSTSHVNGNPNVFAPGADDNASGSAALMHIAEILRQYDFGCSLRYALFTGEEQGFYGSKHYAEYVKSLGLNILGVLNLDMLGYNTPGSPATIELHTRPGISEDLVIAETFYEVIPTYSINLIPSILPDGEGFSDHAPFWNRGYPAILAIEDWADHTPYYHKTQDQLESLNFSYYTEFTKAALATFAHMGCLLEGQLSGTVKDSASNAGLGGATVEAWQDGNLVRSTTTLPDGTYQLALQPGSYTIQISALDHLSATYQSIPANHSETTRLNASLQPCVFIKDLKINLSNHLPQVSESVDFTASVSAGEAPINFHWDFGDEAAADGAIAAHAYSNRGGYLVKLRAENACGAPQSVGATVFVDVDLFYIPISMKGTTP